MTHLLGHIRKFNGKNYTAKFVKKTKIKAEKLADTLHMKNWNVRIQKTKCPMGGHEYYLFVRRE